MSEGLLMHSLPAELTIYTVGDVCAQCRGWAAPAADGSADEELRIDASAVAEVDGAGVQVLIALANGLVRQQRRLVLGQPSEPLRRACATLGTTALLAEGAPA